MKINSNRIAREGVLGELYIAFSKGEHGMGINDLCGQLGKTDDEVRKLLVDLHKDGFTAVVTNDNYKILPNGVLYTEHNKLAPAEMVLENRAIRAGILDELALLHAAAGMSQSIPVQTIANSMAKNMNVVLNHIEILNELGLILPDRAAGFHITASGLLDAQNRKSPPQTP